MKKEYQQHLSQYKLKRNQKLKSDQSTTPNDTSYINPTIILFKATMHFNILFTLFLMTLISLLCKVFASLFLPPFFFVFSFFFLYYAELDGSNEAIQAKQLNSFSLRKRRKKKRK